MQQRNQDGISALQARAGVLGASIVAAVFISACGSSETPQATAPAPAKREQAPEDPTAKMARAVTVGSSATAVTLKYEILNKPIVGQPIEIELAVVPAVHADSLAIAFAGSPGLTVSSDAAPPIESVKVGQIERVKFTAQAQQESVYYVNVTATMYTAGTSEVRNFAIPLIVATAQPPAAEASSATTAAPKKS